MGNEDFMIIQNRFAVWALSVIGAAVLSAIPAHAGVIFAVDFVAAPIGSTGNALEITMQNTGPSPLTVGAFAFQIFTSSTDITFTSTTIDSTPATYIFSGDSLFGPTISLLSPGQSMDGSDVAFSGSANVGAGAIVGLGHVLFDVAASGTFGPVAVTLVKGSSNLSDENENLIPVDTLIDGQISMVPEPASAVLLACAVLGVFAVRSRAGLRRG